METVVLMLLIWEDISVGKDSYTSTSVTSWSSHTWAKAGATKFSLLFVSTPMSQGLWASKLQLNCMYETVFIYYLEHFQTAFLLKVMQRTIKQK